MIIDMRLPVTSSRRCEQITALGASEVPDVKMSAQMLSTSGSMPASVAPSCAAERVAERGAEQREVAIVGVGEPGGREHGRQPVGDRLEKRRVPGLGDHEAAVRVLDVAQQVHVAARVVETDYGRPDQRRAAEREEVVGGVVEQHRDMARAGIRELGREQRREPHRLLVVLRVRPLLGAELDRDPVAGLLGVPAQEGRGVGRHEGRLPRRGADRGLETDIGVRDYA